MFADDWWLRNDLKQPMRVVEFQPLRTSKATGPKIMLLATDRLDLEVDLIAPA